MAIGGMIKKKTAVGATELTPAQDIGHDTVTLHAAAAQKTGKISKCHLKCCPPLL